GAILVQLSLVRPWCHAVPAFEGALECALFGKAEHERDVTDAQTRVTQVVVGEFAPHAVNAGLVMAAALAEALLQGRVGQAQRLRRGAARGNAERQLFRQPVTEAGADVVIKQFALQPLRALAQPVFELRIGTAQRYVEYVR